MIRRSISTILQAIAAYLEEAFDTGDTKFIADAMGVVARASGMSEIAKAAGLSRESLYKALSAEWQSGTWDRAACDQARSE